MGCNHCRSQYMQGCNSKNQAYRNNIWALSQLTVTSASLYLCLLSEQAPDVVSHTATNYSLMIKVMDLL